ncbi:MAG TPA: helix-turn-helix domain-containing protein [Erysipelotrichaceae bacterium]|nr:helix-turn-helix domain-containing protein [Erysipelotrichaceae bacterium]
MINFNVQKLKELLISIYTLTHIKVSIHTVDFQEMIYYPEMRNSFCKALSENPASHTICRDADTERFNYVKRTKKTELFICPFGLIEVFTPIIIGDEIVGYIVLGQAVGENSDINQMAQKTAQYGFDKNTMLNKLEQLERIKEEIFPAASTLLDACAKYVYIDNYINISQNELMGRIHNYIYEHMSERITVDSLCKHFYLSRVSLYKLFEGQVKTSVADYIKNERLKQCKYYLQNSSFSIKEIANLVGIEYNYLSKVFYKSEDITPKKYQKKYKRVEL